MFGGLQYYELLSFIIGCYDNYKYANYDYDKCNYYVQLNYIGNHDDLFEWKVVLNSNLDKDWELIKVNCCSTEKWWNNSKDSGLFQCENKKYYKINAFIKPKNSNKIFPDEKDFDFIIRPINMKKLNVIERL